MSWSWLKKAKLVNWLTNAPEFVTQPNAKAAGDQGDAPAAGSGRFGDAPRLPESAGSGLGRPGLWNRPRGVGKAPGPAVDPPSPG